MAAVAEDAEAGCAVPSRVLPCPCVPRRVPKHGSVPQPHVPLQQRLCRAVPACSRLSLSVCPRAVSVRSSVRAVLEGPRSPSSLLTRFAVPRNESPAVI